MRHFGGKEFWQERRKSETIAYEKEFKDFKKEIYGKYEFQTWTNISGHPVLKVYKGKSGKAISHYRYHNEAHRQDTINEFKKRADGEIKRKKEQAEAYKNMVNLAKVGDVLYSTWGYEQTNVDFYEVVGLTAKSVKIIKLGQTMVENTGYMSETVVPNRDLRGKEVMTKRIRMYNDKSYYVSISSYASASKWGGDPILQTHYH